MPRPAQQVTPATTDDRIVVGVDPALSANQWRMAYMAPPPPREPSCDIQIETRTFEGTFVQIGDGYFDDDAATSDVYATRQGGAPARDMARQYAEEELRREVFRKIDQITRSMQSLTRATREAAAHIQHFVRYFAEFVLEHRQATGWLGDSDNDVEHYRVTAEISRQRWREAAYNWNLWQQRQRRDRWGYNDGWMLANTTNSWLTFDQIRDNWASAYRIPQYYWQDTTAVPDYSAYTGYTTGSSAISYTMSATSWQAAPPECDCAGANTCSHCVAREEARRLTARRVAKKKRQREIAQKRGRRLLLSLLTEEQKHEYAKTRTFRISAKDGRVFRLRKGMTAELLNEHDQAIASYCIHLYGEQVGNDYVSYVPEDTTIAQILMLQTDPAEFERIANITKLHPSPPPAQTPNDVRWERARRTIRDRTTARAVQYLEEYDEVAEAMLRAEGIQNPRQWVAELRRQVTTIAQATTGCPMRRASCVALSPTRSSRMRCISSTCSPKPGLLSRSNARHCRNSLIWKQQRSSRT